MTEQRFEHRIVECFDGYERETLARIEKDGFELIAVIRIGVGMGHGFKMFFKRLVELEEKK